MKRPRVKNSPKLPAAIEQLVRERRALAEAHVPISRFNATNPVEIADMQDLEADINQRIDAADISIIEEVFRAVE